LEEKGMEANGVSDEELRQLIKKQIGESGITLSHIIEQNPHLAYRIKRGFVDNFTVFKCAQFLGLIGHRGMSGEVPSREALVVLFKFGKPSCPCERRLVDWGCNGEH
jgi:hypothetical protein